VIDEASLIEQLTSAYRARRHRGEVAFSPAFYDLGPDAREAAFEHARATRALEAALDPEGLSSTAHAVLARIAFAR
jgi:hypothetical protein